MKKHIVEILPFAAAFAASSIMVVLMQAPYNFSFLAWFSMVPFILVWQPDTKILKRVVTCYVVSVFCWLASLCWIKQVTFCGWIAYCMYAAILWPLLGLAIRYCRKRRWPLLVVVPVLMVGMENFQGLFLGGFYWRFLAHSQYDNTTLIQICDIFGTAGLSLLVGTVNMLIADLIIHRKEVKFLHRKNIIKISTVATVMCLVIFYGMWRINQSESFTEKGPVIASVQSNIPQSVKESFLAEESIFIELLENSIFSTSANPELILWPETMVQGTLDKRILKELTDRSLYRLFDQKLKEHAMENNAYVLAGTLGGTPKTDPNGNIKYDKKYNSAMLYTPDGNQAPEQYNKIYLVPYGEVVPFKKSAPWLHEMLMYFTPYDYDYTLDYGTDYTVFEMNGRNSDRVYHFSVMICYEDTMSKIARKFALDENGEKQVDWLVNISNDGWFVKFENGKVIPSAELSQHTVMCVFRAVENRLSVIRSVNTGISCMVDPVGRIQNSFIGGNLPEKAFDRQGMAGWFADYVPIDKRVTFFSRHGRWLAILCQAVFFLVLTEPVAVRVVRKVRKTKAPII